MTGLMIGDLRLDAMVDLDPFRLPLQMLLPDADPAALAPDRAWLEPLHLDGDHLLLSIHSLLLRVDGRIILVDSCVGEDKPRPRRADWHQRRATGYLERLAAAGVRPEQVDTVLCTHLHADHVGWNTRLCDGRWIPTFPRARYLVGRAELGHWQAQAAGPGPAANHGAFQDSVLPVLEAGLVDPVDDGYQVHHGVTVRPLPGHTPGQIGLAIDRGTRALCVGDAIHSPVQFAQPAWSSAFCSDPAAARATRAALLAEAADSGCWLVPAHLRGVPACRLRRDGERYRPA